MNAMAGFFPTSEAADAAMADLKLHGFPDARLEPCPSAGEAAAPPDGEGEGAAMAGIPAGSQPVPDVNADDGGTPFPGWTEGGSRWVLFNAFQIGEQERGDLGGQGAAFVVVEGGEAQEAVVRTILERNGAERVRRV